MRFEEIVSAFAADLAAPGATPGFTHGRMGEPDARRFQVYRNNVASSLIRGLEGRFPVVRRLVGDDFFRAMAGAYVAARKPSSAVLIHYGADFPEFVQGFPPAAELPYLADVARLENAWMEAYHAAEAAYVGLAELAAFPSERFAELVFAFHPSARLLRFAHPAATIWAAHQGSEEPLAPEVWQAEEALIVRPDADVVVRLLPAGGFDFALALFAGAPLAVAAAPLAEAGDDVGAHLIGLLEVGAISGISSSSE
jgi:Putative DNA-binding domain